MQPVGLSSTSELFDSLKVYLNNKKRLQPIIGLGSIIECVKVGARCREASYLCEVCVCRLSKADMRNHIMGSLHRYNYIKAWHPHLVCEWKENSDLSRLAWPLMEIAKKIEGKEGSGDVQLIEVEDVLYQKMATLSENDAVTLIKTVREWQGGPESHSQTTSVQLEQHSVQSQRIVLLGRHELRRSERSLDADVISHKMSTQTNNPYLMHSTAAPTIESEGWLTNISTSHSNHTEPSGFSENSSSFLHGYRGTKPLIGLCRVVECRSDTGCTFLFLCHCCRIRSNKRDVIDHLTDSSHLINYLTETYPEQVEASTADINDNFLQSLAKKVEREEGRGELKVINAPDSLCIQLTGRSYHWCMRMLCKGWDTSTQKNKLTVRGHSVNKTSVEGVTEKRSALLSNWGKRTTAKRKKGKVADTLFTVSLPLTKGPVVLQRTSFSKDILPVSCSPPPASDLFPSPKSDTDDGDAGSFAVDHAEHLYSGDAEAGQYMAGEKNCTVTLYQMADGDSIDNEHFSQPKDTTEREDHKGYWERNHNRHHGSQERSRGNFDEEMATEYRHKHTEELSPAVPHTYIPCTPEMGYAEQWYYQQPLQNPHMAPDHTSLMTAAAGRSGGVAPRSDAARINACPQLGDVVAHSGSFAPETSVYSLGTEQRRVPTYMEFTAGNVQITPQSYMTHPLAYHGVQTGHGAMSDPSYGYGQTTKPDCYFPYPDSSSSGGGDMSWSNAFIPPVPSLYYGTNSDFNFRDTGRRRVDDFQGWR
ncbi:uncharacterized protein LOC118124452 isoform X2 [Hippoglossus stenolepis]|uniref:uncharacterized protein LOC118124452 isoform X2 n=1 Tax=Hippoglossus stenolepis TaxID=195615 RepID=UPI001FAF9D2B|nr:uncharacterized protein LOC118124452 isoform X2 [Hippoglossus stenolepis]XP_035038149.2 uncharacterized protein LOC118124452 isoform X2 [Hippoglossus stenolepis]XP_035038150.2 uncharacterized protein LOC118124452 isoform X2 [Hippoglossus stenolepis]